MSESWPPPTRSPARYRHGLAGPMEAQPVPPIIRGVRHTLWLLAGLALVASLTIGPRANAGTGRASRGTVVFIADGSPPNLQGPWIGNNLYATLLVLNNIWYGCQIRDATTALVPRLCTDEPKLIKQHPLTVRFTYKDDAEWSDGKEVTAADFRATWKVFVDPRFDVISRSGWEDIATVGGGRGKTVTVVFKKPYAAWESLVSGGPYPAHLVAGKNMNSMFVDSIPVSSGPWLFESWNKGSSLTVRKNPRFKASVAPPMKLDRIVFRYILDTNSRFQSLKANEGQVMETTPQLQIAGFMKDRRFVVDRKVGYAYEHIDIQFGPKGHPALKQPYVRRALITGINRSQVTAALYSEIYPGLPTLQSLMFKPFETASYRKNFAVHRFSQRMVITNLRAHGCTGGPDTPRPGNDDIFSCPRVGKLSFRFHTTAGNQLRTLTFEIIQKQLKSVGIELLPRFQTGGVLFGQTLPSRDWDLMLFSWIGSPDSPITAKDLYGCGGDQNDGAYCNRKLTAILTEVSTTLDAGKRATMLNQGEATYIVKDIPSIPIVARPFFLIRSASVKGPVLNAGGQGATWNANTWTVR
jgi:peptide/nickel transport system substrate-binding protein